MTKEHSKTGDPAVGSTRLVGRGWAWKIRDERGNWSLCNWAEPTKDALLKQGKPSPEAKPVWIKLTANDKLSHGHPTTQKDTI